MSAKVFIEMNSNQESGVPQWKAANTFNYPIADVPVKYLFPTNLTMDDIQNVSLLGHNGSHSTMYLGKYGGTTVVVKMISKINEDDPVVLKEFLLEYGTLARLSHPNIIKVLGAGRVPRQFIVLEYLAGGTMHQKLKSHTADTAFLRMFVSHAFNTKTVLKLGKNIADAMNYAHEVCHPNAMFLHRDLKPDNIGFTSDGTLKLFDFGLVTCVYKTSTPTGTYAMTGCAGSLRYMAPEVVLRKPYNEKVDVYSFGIIMWQLLQNKIPYHQLYRDEFVEKVIQEKLRPSLVEIISISTQLAHLIQECWSEKPQERPSFNEISNRLHLILRSEFHEADSLSG